MANKKFVITLKRSLIGCNKSQRETIRCLGLTKRQQTVDVNDTPANRGQILKVQHMLDVVISK